MDCVNSFNLDQSRHLDQLFGVLGALHDSRHSHDVSPPRRLIDGFGQEWANFFVNLVQSSSFHKVCMLECLDHSMHRSFHA